MEKGFLEPLRVFNENLQYAISMRKACEIKAGMAKLTVTFLLSFISLESFPGFRR